MSGSRVRGSYLLAKKQIKWYNLIGISWQEKAWMSGTRNRGGMDMFKKWTWGKFFFILWLVLLLLGLIFSGAILALRW